MYILPSKKHIYAYHIFILIFIHLFIISNQVNVIQAKWRGGIGRWKTMTYNYEEGPDAKPPPEDTKTKDSKGKEVVVGTVLRAKWRKGETWYTGHVDLVNLDGTVDIQYDDGDYEWFVKPENLQVLKGKKIRKVTESKLVARPDMKKFLSGIDYAIYGAAKSLPKKGEITFIREDNDDWDKAELSIEEKGALLSEEDLLDMDLYDPRVKWLKEAAKSTANKTQCGLGNFGLGILYRMDGNAKESLKFFTKSADCGNAGAQRILGLTYGGSYQAMTSTWNKDENDENDNNNNNNNNNVRQNKKKDDKKNNNKKDKAIRKEDKMNGGDEGVTAKAILHLYFAAMGGDAPAQLALGTRHLYGRGVPKKCSTAVLYLQAAAETAVKSVEERGHEHVVESVLLSQQTSDGLEGRRARQRHGSGAGDGLDDDIIQYLNYAARNGDDKAQHSLGEIYYFGIRGIRRDAMKAKELFEQSAESGNKRAMAMLGHLYGRGHGVKADNETALKWFNKGAKKGSTLAHARLGMFNLFGLSIERNITKARHHFQRAANEGDAGAMHSLGILRIKGLGVRRDYVKALRLFQQSARQGHTLAQNKLAQMKLLGLGVPPSCEDAAKTFKSVAEHGPWSDMMKIAHRRFQQGKYDPALWLYGMLAGEGYNIAESNAAFLLEQNAVKKIKPLAIFTNEYIKPWLFSHSFLRKLYTSLLQLIHVDIDDDDDDINNNNDGSKTIGTTQKNAEQSIAFYNLAAEQGSSLAYVKIGDLYYYGLAGKLKDGTPNYKKSYSYYSKASRLQNAQGRFNLGFMYEHGLGVKRDLHLAKRFYEETTSLDSESKLPVYLIVMIMRLRSAWVRLNCRLFGLPIPHIEKMLLENRVNTGKKGSKSKKASKEQSKDKSGQVLKKGYYVQARWRGKRKYYSGWVHNVNADGTLDVQYDDGDFEHNVPVSLIKRVSTNVHPSIKAEEDKLKNGGDGGSNMGFLSKYLPESYYDSDATFLFIVLCLFSYIFLMKLFIVLKRALSCCF